MVLITVVLSILLSLFSTAVMGYISMAVPIGPWIAPMLVLVASIFFKLLPTKNDKDKKIALVVASGSIGGILATACGFSFPTLFFLDPQLFNTWLAQPIYFVSVIGGLAFIAGWFGVWIANILEERLIIQEKYEFPIGQVIYKMIAAQKQARKAIELAIGFIGTLIFSFFQSGLAYFKYAYHIPRFLVLIPRMQLGIFRIPLTQIDFAIFPMLLAIGFIAGHLIAIPLFVGALAKIFVTSPLNVLFFPAISSMEFLLAFCSGMVISGALVGLVKTPKTLFKTLQKVLNKKNNHEDVDKTATRKFFGLTTEYVVEFILVVVASMLFLTYFGFSLITQLYLLIFTFVCTYQIAVIAGRIGLAQLGRFATFVMVPAMLLFNIDFVQIVLISTFVQVAGGVCADVLFSRKLGVLAHLNHRKLKCYQYLGLLVSALSVGIIFLLLIKHFGLGSAELFAQKAYARRLLIDVKNFNVYVLVLGFIFGWLLKVIRVHPMLVLGGLLMPITISLGLVLGGTLTYFFDDKEEAVPFWSGVFAGNSVWMLIKAVIG